METVRKQKGMTEKSMCTLNPLECFGIGSVKDHSFVNSVGYNIAYFTVFCLQ